MKQTKNPYKNKSCTVLLLQHNNVSNGQIAWQDKA